MGEHPSYTCLECGGEVAFFTTPNRRPRYRCAECGWECTPESAAENLKPYTGAKPKAKADKPKEPDPKAEEPEPILQTLGTTISEWTHTGGKK